MKNTNSTPSNMQPKHTTLIQLPVLNEWELYSISRYNNMIDFVVRYEYL